MKTIYGYLIIPIWILGFLMSTSLLVILWVNALIAQKFFKKANRPLFKPRSIFPYENT